MRNLDELNKDAALFREAKEIIEAYAKETARLRACLQVAVNSLTLIEAGNYGDGNAMDALGVKSVSAHTLWEIEALLKGDKHDKDFS